LGGGVFACIDDVTLKAECDEVVACCKRAAGFAIEAVNAAEARGGQG
jgi:hypothetical protein